MGTCSPSHEELAVCTVGLHVLWPPGKGWKLSYPQLSTSNTFGIIITALGRCGLHHGHSGESQMVESVFLIFIGVWSEVKSLSRVWLFATPWTVTCQAPPSMGFSRQEYWSGLPVPSPGDLSDPGIEPRSPAFQADALTSRPPGKPLLEYSCFIILC